jgi:hypothetical protein
MFLTTMMIRPRMRTATIPLPHTPLPHTPVASLPVTETPAALTIAWTVTFNRPAS